MFNVTVVRAGGPRDAHAPRPEGGRGGARARPRLLAARVRAQGRRRRPARAAGAQVSALCTETLTLRTYKLIDIGRRGPSS